MKMYRKILSVLGFIGIAASALGCSPVQVQAVPAQPFSLLRPSPSSVGRQATATTPLTITPETGVWDLSHYDSVYLKLRNPGTQSVTVWARADNPEAKDVTDSVRMAAVLRPHQTEMMRLRLMRQPENPTFAPFQPFFMYVKDISVREYTLDPAAVARVVVWLDGAGTEQSVVIESVTAQGEGVPGPVSFYPWIDKYGQYVHTDWPGKIYADADFAQRLQEEKAEMAAHPGPANWDEYGGWKNGPKQKATGFFYAKKVDGKWWLVDPIGHLFWSYGPTGVGSGGEGSPVTDKEKWFTELPPEDGPLAKYWGKGKGARFRYYSDGKEWKSFSFSGANAERKYGPNWREETADFLHTRLRSWGLNTIANWSDPVVYSKRKTPYTATLTSGAWSLNHFPDVFDPAWEHSMNATMDQQKNTTANDPWNIGYFVDNELIWGNQPHARVAVEGVLKARRSSPSKQKFVDELKAKYADIAALNTAWGSAYPSWDAVLESQTLPQPRGVRFNEDADQFGTRMAEKYFKTVRDAVKRVAPNTLYLGCRFHGHIDTSIVQLAAKYADVVSWNVYELPKSRVDRYTKSIDRPFIVGEFSVGSDIGRTPFRGSSLTMNPTERIRFLESWLSEAITQPLLVGGHYFQFRDQPLSGRPDGESTLRGFVNSADTPDFRLVQVNQRFSSNMYKMRTTGHAPSPWSNQPIRGMIGVGTWSTQAQFKDIQVTKGRQTLFASDFSKGAQALQGWKTSGGKWEVADGILRQTSEETGVRALIGEPTWSNYTLTLKARKISGSEGFQIFFGSPGDTAKARWNLGGWGNTQTVLEIPGGSSSHTAQKIETGRWYDIKIEVQGPTVKAYLDGKLAQQVRR